MVLKIAGIRPVVKKIYILRNFAFYNFCRRLCFKPSEEDPVTLGLLNILNGASLTNAWAIKTPVREIL